MIATVRRTAIAHVSARRGFNARMSNRQAQPDHDHRARTEFESGLYIVTRHPGAVQWLRRLPALQHATLLPHIDHANFGPGDKVCGVLPLALAARICARGAEVHALTCEIPAELRGVELGAEQLDLLGARIVQYDVCELQSCLQSRSS